MTAANSRARTRVWAAALFVIALVAYAPVVENGFIWDDDDYVTENPLLGTPAGLRDIWLDYRATPQYYPLVHTSFWIEHQLWGLAPAGYHVVNVLLHALGALLAWRVLTLLGLPGAWLAAAIFAVHPVHVESVAWVTERKNVLSGVFALASLAAYLRSAGFGSTVSEADRGDAANGYYAVALLAFVCALLSKTVTGSLPAVLVLLLWWRRGRVTRGDWIALLPFFALAGAFGLLTVQLETQHVGAAGPEWDLSFAERCVIAGRALWFYVGKLVWPHPLIFNYPRWVIDVANPLAWGPVVAAVLAVGIAWLGRRLWGRGPLVAILIFAGTLFPALGFFDVYPMRYSFVADHFQYLASLALIALFAAGAVGAARRIAPDRESVASLPTALAAAVLLASLGAVTFAQARVYRGHETLWRDTLAKNPTSWLAHDALGVLAENDGRLDEAIAHYRASLAIEPRQHEGYNKLGNALRLRGDLTGAIAQIERSLAIEPRSVAAWNSLGLAHHDRGDLAAAVTAFEKALSIHPDFAAAHTNLGITLQAQGDFAAAEFHHRAALRIDPDLAAAHTNLAVVLLAQGDVREAIRHLERVVLLQPDSASARRNLRAARRQLRRNEGAGGRAGS